MVTRTTDIDHPDRNCVSRVCDKCEVVFIRYYCDSEKMLDAKEVIHRNTVKIMARIGKQDLCRKCTEASDEEGKAIAAYHASRGDCRPTMDDPPSSSVSGPDA